jgi:hypothetical protein
MIYVLVLISVVLLGLLLWLGYIFFDLWRSALRLEKLISSHLDQPID